MTHFSADTLDADELEVVLRNVEDVSFAELEEGDEIVFHNSVVRVAKIVREHSTIGLLIVADLEYPSGAAKTVRFLYDARIDRIRKGTTND